ncbi:MAG: hypothetical protein FWH52_07700, partial [Synergistaceae bacterium]|nr:hypothetical protein [Synergistaceae bacterium]
SRLIPDPCSCGAKTLGKFAAVRKRIGNITRLAGGDEIYPALFDGVLMDMPGFVDYRAVLEMRNSREILLFRVELNQAKCGKIPEIRKRLLTLPALAKSVQAGAMTEPVIEIAAPGELRSTDTRKKRITDLR